jgi:lipopolysaccharide/colanic/teichoic acid biosynthesis glycosyltransferase
MKRLFDIFFAALWLVVLSPVLLVLAVLVKVSDGGPMLFRQRRIGQGGRPFYIVKFRSMVVNAENAGLSITAQGDPRITRMGRILRRTKLDELPQLWNVLVGEMSFVGPRPEVPRYVAHYTLEQRRVLLLKPGITDLATIEFRREEEMLKAESGKTDPPSSNFGGQGTEDGLAAPERQAKAGGRGTEDRGQGAGGGEMEEFYMKYCVPRKIELSLEYARRASLWQDTLIILRTLFPFLIRNNLIQPQTRCDGATARRVGTDKQIGSSLKPLFPGQ